MRVWDIHPGYLSCKNLLGQHAEIHALFSVLRNNKKGYQSHPETLRWKGRLNKLIKKHDLTVKEMELRNYNHGSPLISVCESSEFKESVDYLDHPKNQFEILRQKYKGMSSTGRIPLPKRGSDFWAHNKYSVMLRGYNYYKDIQNFIKQKENLPISQEKELIERVVEILELPANRKAIMNVIPHLWGYLKEETSKEEKEQYMNFTIEETPSMLKFLYNMAKKYERKYLLCSTIFADEILDLVDCE